MSQIEPNLIDALLTMGISREEIIASYAEFIHDLDLEKEGGDDYDD